jgi:hypothetical protein
MKNLIRKILKEEVEKTTWEYQERDIGGESVFYKRQKGEEIWSFTNELDFCKNSTKQNIIVYKKQ